MHPQASAIAMELLFDNTLLWIGDCICIRYISCMYNIEQRFHFIHNFKPSDDPQCIVITPVPYSKQEVIMHIPVDSYCIPDSLRFCAGKLGCTKHDAEQVGLYIREAIFTSNRLVPITIHGNTYYVLLVWSDAFKIGR